jgi:hypothetical protein
MGSWKHGFRLKYIIIINTKYHLIIYEGKLGLPMARGVEQPQNPCRTKRGA